MSRFSNFKEGYIQIAMNSEDGSKISGNFQVKNRNGNLIYEGDLLNGQRNGKGIEYLGKEYSKSCDDGYEFEVICHNLPIYEGHWKNDHYEGKGDLYEIETCCYEENKINYHRILSHGTFEKGVLKKGVKVIYDKQNKWHEKAWKAFGKEDMESFSGIRKPIFGVVAFEVGSWDKNNQFSGKIVRIPKDKQFWCTDYLISLEENLADLDISLNENE
jgi:hypothetical protein